MAKTENTLPIVDIWTKSDATKKTEKVILKGKKLKSNADAFMVDARSKQLDADEAYEKAMADSFKNPNFGAINAARLAKVQADLVYKEAGECYRSILGMEPPA